MTASKPSWFSKRPFSARCLSALILFLVSGVSLALADTVAAQQSAVWTVGPINVDNIYRDQYCSMRNQFDNGHELVFARDIAGINSIALDLKKKEFEPGRAYSVHIAVKGVTRTIKAVAASTHVIVLNVKRDKSLYDELARASDVAFSWDKTSLRYELKGSADALVVLQECIEKLVMNGSSGNGMPEQAVQLPPVFKKDARRQTNDSEFFDEVLNRFAIMPRVGVTGYRRGADGVRGYTWRDKNMVVEATEVTIPRAKNFYDAFDAYIKEAARACADDFAHTVSDSYKMKQQDILLAETACIGGAAADQASAILGVSNGRTLVIVSYAVSAEGMQQALNARDHLRMDYEE